VHENYQQWLELTTPNKAVWQSRLSELRGVERAYGDLDDHYDRDGLQSVIENLAYSADDERNDRPNPSKIVINGTIRTGLASRKAAVQKYIQFRQDLDSEIARPVFQQAGPSNNDEDTAQIFALERDLQNALRKSMGQLEAGLVIADGGAEKSVASGRIDIFATDGDGCPVVIELKAVPARRDAIAQVLAYMGDIQEDYSKSVRGFLVAPSFDSKAISAARVVPTLTLMTYSFNFSFNSLE
jgi:endonuclease